MSVWTVKYGERVAPFTDDRGEQVYKYEETREESHAGHVLATFERNFYDDSDFYALVWDDVAREIREVQYATTRFYTYGNSAQVDATPDVKRKAGRVIRKLVFRALRRKAEALAKEPTVGKTVTVARGRKVPIGTTGTVVWYGASAYGGSRWSKPPMRVGIDTPNGKVFTDAKNVDVQGWRALVDGAALLERARQAEANEAWRSGEAVAYY